MSNDLRKMVEEATDGDVCVLREGFETSIMGSELACHAPATITLVKLKRGYILVDTGGFGEYLLLKAFLRQRSLSEDKVYAAFITHNHPDHIGNAHLFEQVVMPDSSCSTNQNRTNRYYLRKEGFFSAPGNFIDDKAEKFKIVSTPGHSGWDMSCLFEGKDARVLMCGDLFWSEEDWRENGQYLGLCVNKEMQERSRDWVRARLKPDLVIPGHGPAFAPRY